MKQRHRKQRNTYLLLLEQGGDRCIDGVNDYADLELAPVLLHLHLLHQSPLIPRNNPAI